MNKGFTLVELLAVIVILSVLLIVAVPNVVGTSNRSREQMFCAKTSNIESTAKTYGQDYIDEVEKQVDKSITVSVKQLVESGYYSKENQSCNYTQDNPCVSDPRDNSSMDNRLVTIKIRDKRISASFNYNSDESCTN